MAIHPTAIIDPGAEIHPEAEIGPFCVIADRVTIGAGAQLRNNVTVYGRSSIGEGTVIFPGAVIGGDPQHLGYRGEDSCVKIGAHCKIHECVTVNKGTAGGGLITEVGDHCMIMAYAHVAHDCKLGERVVVGNNTQIAGHVHIGRRAVISGMVGIHHYVTIGELTFIGAMSGVRTDLPPYVMADGVPAEIRNVNVVGLRRDEWGDQDIRAIKAAFRALYHERNGTPLSEAITELRDRPEIQVRPVRSLCDFLERNLSESVNGRLQQARRH